MLVESVDHTVLVSAIHGVLGKSKLQILVKVIVC